MCVITHQSSIYERNLGGGVINTASFEISTLIIYGL